MRTILLLLVVTFLIAACGDDDEPEVQATPTTVANASAANTESAAETDQDTLDTVLERGTILCGVQGALPGFGYEEPTGTFSGLDPDLCWALAAAVFNDTSK